MKKITIAIDGFSSCGKSTMAKSLAKKINYIYIDSGAMYRAITLFCMQQHLIENNVLNETELQKNIKNINIEFKLNTEKGTPDTYLNGINVESEIRSMAVSDNVSIVSAVGFVRKALVTLQQEMGKAKGIVMDGRDIGTVVFPEAEMKVFVTASPEIRAQRRLDELRSKGDKETSFEAVLENLQKRDHLDQTRAESPLKRADDAIILDNSYMTIDEQMQWLVDEFYKIIET